ncbi:hypothetical protein ACGF0D_39405, partial [Kitasatospora sp. NPDC048298]
PSHEVEPELTGKPLVPEPTENVVPNHPEKLNKAEAQSGRQPRTAQSDDARIRRLEAENADLRRINGILRAAAVLFAAELEPGSPV